MRALGRRAPRARDERQTGDAASPIILQPFCILGSELQPRSPTQDEDACPRDAGRDLQLSEKRSK